MALLGLSDVTTHHSQVRPRRPGSGLACRLQSLCTRRPRRCAGIWILGIQAHPGAVGPRPPQLTHCLIACPTPPVGRPGTSFTSCSYTFLICAYADTATQMEDASPGVRSGLPLLPSHVEAPSYQSESAESDLAAAAAALPLDTLDWAQFQTLGLLVSTPHLTTKAGLSPSSLRAAEPTLIKLIKATLLFGPTPVNMR